MKSPEYIIHGTSSEKDAEKIEQEGFRAEEGRATISTDLIYAFKWATEQERRRGSQSKTEIFPEETGRIIIMRTPKEKSVGYATKTDIGINEKEKIVSGYTAKYESGRKQLAIYVEKSPVNRKKEIEKRKHRKNEIKIPKREILMKIVPTSELGKKLQEIKNNIGALKRIDINKEAVEIFEIIKNDPENFISNNINGKIILSELLISTIKTEIISAMRSLSLEVKRARGYSIYNRSEDITDKKTTDKNQLKQKLIKSQSIVESNDFDTGMEDLNRYIRINLKKLIEELKD